MFATDNLITIIMSTVCKYASFDGKYVLEIGPGEGKFTEKILECNPHKLIAVEKDFECVQFLRNRFAEYDNFECVKCDILEYEPPKIDIVIGNIPYYISSDLLVHMRTWDFKVAFIMLQKEFAHRLIEKPGNKKYSRLTATAQYHYNIRVLKNVSRGLFTPVPRVDSSLVMFEKKKVVPLTECEDNILNMLFVHKKNTLANAIKYALSNDKEIKKLSRIFVELYGESILDKHMFKIDGGKIIKGCKVFCKS